MKAYFLNLFPFNRKFTLRVYFSHIDWCQKKRKKEKRKIENKKRKRVRGREGRAYVKTFFALGRILFLPQPVVTRSIVMAFFNLITRWGRRPLTILVCRPLSSLGWCSLASCKKNGVSQQNKVLLKVHIFFPFSLQLPGSWRPSPSLLLKIGAKYAEPIFKPVLAPFFRRCCHPMNCLG